MTRDEALKLITKACESVSATKQVHKLLETALSVVSESLPKANPAFIANDIKKRAGRATKENRAQS